MMREGVAIVLGLVLWDFFRWDPDAHVRMVVKFLGSTWPLLLVDRRAKNGVVMRFFGIDPPGSILRW